MISSYGLAFLWLRFGSLGGGRRAVPFPRRQTAGIFAIFAGTERLELAQISLLCRLGFSHKIDLIVRFRLHGVRIRGAEEG
jgi:hypothetical protein